MECYVGILYVSIVAVLHKCLFQSSETIHKTQFSNNFYIPPVFVNSLAGIKLGSRVKGNRTQ
jgi:hypothetical protein